MFVIYMAPSKLEVQRDLTSAALRRASGGAKA